MITILAQYQQIKKSIPDLIEKSGYRNDFIAKKIKMQPSYFSAKKNRGTWTDADVEKILSFLTSRNNDIENYLDALMVQRSFPGDTATSKEFEKQMGWK